jgi:proteasome lid subunit RPN8/RPN11
MFEAVKKDIRNHAKRVFPQEACGVIVSTSLGDVITPCRNDSLTPLNTFIINSVDYLAASKLGQIVGFYHSHCQVLKEMSEVDKRISQGHGIPSLVYFVPENLFIEYNGEIGDSFSQYTGKDFVIGEQDCYSIIQQFYKNEYQIELGDYSRDENWRKSNPNIYLDNYKKEGFKDVFGQPKRGDVIIFKFKTPADHTAIYLGENFILHQPKRKSCIELLNERYKKYIYSIVRHKSL